ncbi:MAG: ArgE/DapE family peptidase, partial [Firmicutes bacterium HGW-Firmicutes-13]
MDLATTKNLLWQIIDKRRNELFALCSDLIRIPSENPPGNVDEIVSFISRFLEKNGIESRITGPSRKYPNVVAGIGKGPVLIFNGHCDVVPAGDRAQWDFDPFGGEV